MTNCPKCKGKGNYVYDVLPEKCERCQGTGKVNATEVKSSTFELMQPSSSPEDSNAV